MNLWDSLRSKRWKNINFSDVINGCVSAFLTDYTADPERVKRVSMYRLKEFCSSCHMNSDGWCDNSGNKTIENIQTKETVIGCGCNLKCKTALLSSECPALLWGAA